MSSRTSPEDDDPLFPKGSVEEAAAVWLARIDAGLSAEEAGALSVWRSRDPRHEAELAKLELIWHQIETLKPAMASAGGETSGFQTPTKPARRKTLAFPIGLMAAAALIALGLVLWQRSSGDTVTVGANSAPVNYKLTRSARLVALPDGSLVDLRGDSQIETEFTATERRVRLVRGEAYFAVTKNPDRPFLVSVGSTTVRAVGTAFDVKGGAPPTRFWSRKGRCGLIER